MSIEYVRVERAPDSTFKTCGFRGCTSFASHVLRAGDVVLCFCCAQCAAVGVKASRDLIQQSDAFRKFRNEMTVFNIELPKAAKSGSPR
jgi:hypothetical protein